VEDTARPVEVAGAVVYDDQIDVVIESTPASAEARRNAVDRLARIDARGSTNLADGWFRGCEQVAAHLTEGIDRVLLLTDGLANVGITDQGELAHHAAELRARGVSTTTFGVGTDFDESLLQAMADAGGGHFYYIADAAQIRDHIASEVGETLEVVARNAELEVLAGEGVEVDTLSPHPISARGTRSIVGLGDLAADQAVDVVLRLTFPYGQLGRETGIIVRALDREGVFEAAGVADARLTWTWADGHANDTQDRDADVDRAVARQYAARARQEAVADAPVGAGGKAGHGWSSESRSRAISMRRSTRLAVERGSGRRMWSSTSGARLRRSHWERSSRGAWSGAGGGAVDAGAWLRCGVDGSDARK
jgi:Ca-activated chloride channel family protein